MFPFFCFVLFPYANEKRRERFPLATILIIALNIAAFVWEASLWRAGQTSVIKQFAFTPGESPWHTMLTANFLHGGPLHLAFNLWFLWLIAGQVEERMGSPLFAVFYLASGLFTALGHALYSHMVGLPIGAMGASGCVYAVLGAYFVLYPFEDFRFWYFFIMRWGTIKIATFFYVLYALVTGLLSAYADVLNVAGTHVGNWAHMGGLLFGLIVGFAAFGAGPFTGEENPGQKRTRAERRLRRIARRKFYSDASLPEPMTEQEFAAATEDITPPEAVQRGLFFHNGRMIEWGYQEMLLENPRACLAPVTQLQLIEMLMIHGREALAQVAAWNLVEVHPASPEAMQARFQLAQMLAQSRQTRSQAAQLLREFLKSEPTGRDRYEAEQLLRRLEERPLWQWK